MKKLLLILGVLLLVAALIACALAVLHFHAHRSLYDAAAETYDRIHQRAVLCTVLSAVFAIGGAVCLIVRTKM